VVGADVGALFERRVVAGRALAEDAELVARARLSSAPPATGPEAEPRPAAD
jgi:hypothetical protein